MRTIFFLFAITVGMHQLYSQSYADNLVYNPSFETAATASTKFSTSDHIKSCDGWNSPNEGTPAIFSHTKDGYVYDSYGSSWNFKARSGKNVAGLEVYGNSSQSRDYIQGTLSEPLEVGKKYYFSFWVHYHCSGANNIGIAFLPKKIKADSTGLLSLKPATHQASLTPYDSENSWTLVRDSFIAYKSYESFVIGNFFKDEETQLESGRYGHYFAYIDDIEVVPAADNEIAAEEVEAKKESWEYNESIAETTPEPMEVKEEELIVAENPEELVEKVVPINSITFEQASTRLSSEAKDVLKRLITSLEKNPGQRVIIKGYASSEGSESYNQKLSGKRAESVLSYLLSQGLASNRMMTQALGASNPIVPNDTEFNRQLNRRVELEILK